MQIIVRDRNVDFINCFLDYEYSKNITLQCGDIFMDEEFDALVSPANSFGFMNGGIDGVYIQKYGQQLEDRVRSRIRL
jgi:O-acetyl-ADP-ribose deacetylase (regulator of RNase III)